LLVGVECGASLVWLARLAQEPVAFLVSTFGGILAYTWFMRTNGNFTWSAAQQRFVSNWEVRGQPQARLEGGAWGWLLVHLQ
jgi:hypothetical protein